HSLPFRVLSLSLFLRHNTHTHTQHTLTHLPLLLSFPAAAVCACACACTGGRVRAQRAEGWPTRRCYGAACRRTWPLLPRLAFPSSPPTSPPRCTLLASRPVALGDPD